MGLLDKLARIKIGNKLGGLDPNARQPVFYSALNEAIRTHAMKEATPEQWLGTIKNLPGVKAEEVKWSGVEDYLKAADAPPTLSRDDLYRYLDEASETYAPDEFYMTSRGEYANKEEWLNDYRIQDAISEYQSNRIADEWFNGGNDDFVPSVEIEPIGPRPASKVGAELAKARRELEAALNATNRTWGEQFAPQVAGRIPNLEAEYQRALAREARDPLTPDMFTGQREIDIEPEPVGYRAHIRGGYGDVNETLDELFPNEDTAQEAAYNWIRDWERGDGFYAFEESALANGDFYDDAVEALMESDPPNFGTAYNDYALSGGKDYEELVFTLPYHEGEKAGTHWDEYVDDPVLAHVRFDTRMKDGKKILAIQEVQSDWHQQGRKNGFEGQNSQEAIDAAFEKYQAAGRVKAETRQQQRDAVLSAPDDLLVKLAEATTLAARRGHPDGDPDLARNVVYYLRNGALPPGTPRDDAGYVRHFADNLIFTAAEAPTYWGQIIEGGQPDLIKTLQTLKEQRTASELAEEEARVAWRAMTGGIPDVPFKNNVWASMVMKRMARYAADNGYDGIAWSGKIKNGSVREGQKGSDFYDKILVNEMNKLGKKSGVQVGSTYMNGFDWNSVMMTPEFKEFLKKGLPLFMWPLFAGGAVSGGLLSRGQKGSEV